MARIHLLVELDVTPNTPVKESKIVDRLRPGIIRMLDDAQVASKDGITFHVAVEDQRWMFGQYMHLEKR